MHFYDYECTYEFSPGSRVSEIYKKIKILPLGIFSFKKFSEVEILEILISKLESDALPFWPWDYKIFSENNTQK